MKTLLSSLIVLFFSLPSAAQHQNERRWLIVYTAEEGHAQLANQRDVILFNQEAFFERKLALLWVNDQQQIKPIFNVPTSGGNLPKTIQRLNLPQADFQVVLVGLDGGVKLISETHVTLAELTKTIDAMPMRRNELNAQKKNKNTSSEQ